MKISDEKILDYIDGILSKEEENDVKNAIEQDENIKNTFLELKQGKAIGEAAFLHDVMSAPELPNCEIKTNKKNWFERFKTTPFISTAVAASVTLAFLGGIQTQVAMNKNERFEVAELREVMSINSDFVTMGTIIRGIENNNKFEKWFIASNTAVIVRAREDTNKDWMQVEDNAEIKQGSQIQLILQSLKEEKKVSIDLINEDGSTENFVINLDVKPGVLTRKAFNLNVENGPKKISFYENLKNNEKNIIGNLIITIID